jgi:hypothetical protein
MPVLCAWFASSPGEGTATGNPSCMQATERLYELKVHHEKQTASVCTNCVAGAAIAGKLGGTLRLKAFCFVLFCLPSENALFCCR